MIGYFLIVLCKCPNKLSTTITSWRTAGSGRTVDHCIRNSFIALSGNKQYMIFPSPSQICFREILKATEGRNCDFKNAKRKVNLSDKKQGLSS